MQITSKEEFNALSQRGLLGNFLRTWTVGEWVESDYEGWLTIQSKDKQSPHFIPWVTCGFDSGMKGFPSVSDGVDMLLRQGANLDQMYFREVPGPRARRVIQFEAMLAPTWTQKTVGAGVELVYETHTSLPLRGIRERAQAGIAFRAHGLLAQSLLRTKLSPTSYDTLQDIWDRYPTAIIEATEFSERVGVFGQRLVVWEVRDF